MKEHLQAHAIGGVMEKLAGHNRTVGLKKVVHCQRQGLPPHIWAILPCDTAVFYLEISPSLGSSLPFCACASCAPTRLANFFSFLLLHYARPAQLTVQDEKKGGRIVV